MSSIPFSIHPMHTRMSSQSSYFLVWGNRKDSLEDMLSDKRYQIKKPDESQPVITYGDDQVDGIIFRFFVYADRKQSLMRELDAVGINEKALFPGLDGIGRYIEQKYRFDYNEAKEVL